MKTLVEQKRELGWTFAYIGANQDAVEVASELSISNALGWTADSQGMKKMSEKLCEATMKFSEMCCDDCDAIPEGGYANLFAPGDVDMLF